VDWKLLVPISFISSGAVIISGVVWFTLNASEDEKNRVRGFYINKVLPLTKRVGFQKTEPNAS
jgi:hypothetical protein